jgi:hypothetical protein
MRTSIAGLLAAGLLACTACTPDWARDNDSDVLLVMRSVLGQKGGNTGTPTTQLLSDVRSPGIINDNAQLVLGVTMKNPLVTSGVAGSGLNDVLLERYVVRYYRADGRGTPGVDVPHDVSGEMSGRITPGGELTTSIIVVRHQAKEEPPLRNMFSEGGEDVVTMAAEITVYGHTVSKKTVTASGRLEIVFADFADTAS